MTDPADFYAKAVAAAPPASMEGGASGYFSAPSANLDPNLFEDHTLRPEVRAFVTDTLYRELTKLGLRRPAQWVSIWLAGSGIGYQWHADRGNGDLDVLFGVDFPALVRMNEDWGGMSEDQFATWLNEHLKSDLWPRTAHTQFGQQTYEVTFYLNPGTGRDITAINPYAAYDIRRNQWTVHPTVVNDPNVEDAYPKAWFTAASADTDQAAKLVERYNGFRDQLGGLVPGSPQWHNVGQALKITGDQARWLFEDIHGGRHQAFEPGGHGYGDYHNFRWQLAKKTGAIRGLSGILEAREAGSEASDSDLYGGPIEGATEALNRAALVNHYRPGLR